ncbi:unnamed protein product, partial [Didymodactylos carnosus]
FPESSDKADEQPIRIKITSSTSQNEHDSTTTRCKDTLLKTETASDLLGANIKKAFKCVIEKHHEIQMDQSDLKILLKQKELRETAKSVKFTKRDFKVAKVMAKNIKQINKYCSIRFKNNRFSESVIRNRGNVLLTSGGFCSFKMCPFKFVVHVKENGEMIMDCTGAIIHTGTAFHARPIRRDERQVLHDELAMSASATGMFNKKLLATPQDVLSARNLDDVGKNPNLYHKIASYNHKEALCLFFI